MSLEGRKFHFTRDEDGHIYAENEIETEIANREGWLLPPRKGERRTEHYNAVCGTKRVEIVYEATGELVDGFPIYIAANVREVRDSVFATQNPINENIQRIIITNFAILSRSIYLSSQYVAAKLIQAIRGYVENGACISSADEDSVCGGTCEVCKEAQSRQISSGCFPKNTNLVRW